MGYFNIFYKITRIIDMLTRKRNRRFIIILLIIIGVIFLLHNKGYCAQSDADYTTDTTYFILSEYQNFIDDFCLGFQAKYGNDTTATNSFNEFFYMIKNGWYPYFFGNTSTSSIVVVMYKRTNNVTLYDTSLVYNDYLRVPSTGYNVDIPQGDTFFLFRSSDKSFQQSTIASARSYGIPQILLYKIPIEIVDILQQAGYGYNGDQQTMIDIKYELQQQNNKLDRINSSLTNTTYDENVVDFDTSSVDNVSDTEIQGLFTGVIGSFQNSLASYGGTITKIIPLPHGGQLEIPSNIVSSHLGNLSALVEAFWYFVFGIYLFRFVSNLIHKIKSGDILNGYTNDNEIITSSML